MTSLRTITVSDYDPNWPLQFAKLRDFLAPVLGDLALSVEHIGSTSVPGLAAKPVIDSDIVIASRADLPATVTALQTIAYTHRGDLGIPTREAFRYEGDGDFPAHHLYVCAQDSPELRRHLAFRDYLRLHPDEARACNDLKKDLARRFPHDIDAYIEGKSEFIQRIYQLAL